jgi:hypothetical protein
MVREVQSVLSRTLIVVLIWASQVFLRGSGMDRWLVTVSSRTLTALARLAWSSLTRLTLLCAGSAWSRLGLGLTGEAHGVGRSHGMGLWIGWSGGSVSGVSAWGALAALTTLTTFGAFTASSPFFAGFSALISPGLLALGAFG